MKHKFQFRLNQIVTAMDHAEPRRPHRGMIIKRWLEPEETPRDHSPEPEVFEFYNVLVGDGKQIGMFRADDLTTI